MNVKGLWIASIVGFLAVLSGGTSNAASHRFEHSSSWKKPSSETHRWSYERACDNCLAEIEKRHGVDWKVVDVEFEDKGRSTKTRTDRWGKRTWKCTHTVVAVYNVVHRGRDDKLANSKFVEDQIVIKHKMLNEDYVPASKGDSADRLSLKEKLTRPTTTDYATTITGRVINHTSKAITSGEMSFQDSSGSGDPIVATIRFGRVAAGSSDTKTTTLPTGFEVVLTRFYVEGESEPYVNGGFAVNATECEIEFVDD